MASSQKPPWTIYLVFIFLVLLGVGLIWNHVVHMMQHKTSEEELTLAEGKPDRVSEVVYQGGRYVKFTVAGRATRYASNQPHYEDVLSVVQSGEPVQIWVSMKEQTVMPNAVRLYKVNIGNRPILTFAEVAPEKEFVFTVMFIIGCFAFLLGAGGLVAGLTGNLRFDASPNTGGTENSTIRDRYGWVFMPISTYAIIIGVHCFSSDVQAKQVEAIGAEPLGLPVTLVIAFIQTVLFIPMPWVFWHMNRLSKQAMKDSNVFGIIAIVSAGIRHPELRRSLIVLSLGFLYFGLSLAWLPFVAAWNK